MRQESVQFGRTDPRGVESTRSFWMSWTNHTSMSCAPTVMSSLFPRLAYADGCTCSPTFWMEIQFERYFGGEAIERNFGVSHISFLFF